MIDMEKEITFGHGLTMDEGEELDDDLRAWAFDVIEAGYLCDLKLEKFNARSGAIKFEWYGAKKDVCKFFKHYSTYYVNESEETRNKTLETILNK